MIVIKFQFPLEGRTKYGDGWYELDFDVLEKEVDSGIIERFEDETNIQIGQEFPNLLSLGSFRALRAAMWLALLITGRRDKWVAFKADPLTDPRRTEFDVTDPEDEQSSPPPNRAQRRAKTAPSSSAT